MFRRARLNVRPNVRPAGRGGGGAAADPEPQGSAAAREEAAGDAAVEPPPAARPAESDDKLDKSSDAGEPSKPAETPTQRRKRISTIPNLARPRAGPSSAQRSAPKQEKRALQAPDSSASLQKDTSPSEESNVETSLKSSVLPEKKTPVPQVPQFSPLKKSVNNDQTVGAATQENDDTLQKNVPSPLKERPTQERSGTQEEKRPVKLVPAKEKQTCSDRERILKAQKLREMIKEELRKERMLKHRPPVIEGRSPPDRSKMTMRDLIYYLPENNPMKSSLAEEKRTEKNSALSQTTEQEDKSTPDNEEEDEEEEAENAEESQDGPLLVPRVKVAEDGSIILDEESLTVEVLRTKGPCIVEENDPIFERGSTTTYSSFRKSFYTKPWSNKETDMFFLAISMVGTDFSLIGRLFPHRARAEIKNKFKREEKANGWRIDKAFKEKRPFDFELFGQLLEKVLADEEKRKQKTGKSQKSKEKKPSRPRKKPKAKAASTEAANDQDDIQEARISEAETEADAVMAEKENEESLGVSEQAEEQVALDPTLAKQKREKRKDVFEQEEENLPEEMATPSKISEEGTSSKETDKNMVCDTNSDGHTTCREQPESVTGGKQDDTAVTEEERSESCVSVDNIMERESDVNLCSFEDHNDVILEMESAKLRTPDIRDDVSQESHISELTVSKMRSKEGQSEETRERKDKDACELHGSDEKQSVSESGSHAEDTKNEKPTGRGRLQRPKPNLVRSSRRREAATQEKMEVEISSPNLVNTDDKCSGEDGRRNRNEATEVEHVASDTKSEEPEKISKAVVRGCRQRFKPNVTRASAMKEEPEKDAGNDKMSLPQPKGETEQNTDQNNSSDTNEEAAEKGDQILETVSQSSETAGLQDDRKQVVLKPAPLKRGRVQRPKPNLGRTVARKKDATDEKDHEERKTKGEEVEEGVIHRKDENSGPCLKNDVAVHEDAQPCNVMLEEDVSTDAEMKSTQRRQCSQEKSAEVESRESEKGLSDVLKQDSDFNTGESGPQKEEEKKSVVSSARLLRSRFQRPKPNLRMITSRKEVLDLNNKGVPQKDASKEESLTQCDSECSIVPDTDKAGKHEVLQPLEPLGKDESCGTQVVSERPACASPKILSRPEDGELQFCLPEINQDDTSTTNAGIDSKTTTEEESKQTPLRPVQLVRSRFQRYKPNLERAVGKKELKISKNEKEKKPEVKQLILQKDESANTVTRENEAVLCQADALSNEEQEQQEALRVPCISGNMLCEQSSAEKSTSQEGSLSALKPGRFRNSSQRTGPNLERAYIEKEHPAEQKLAAPVEEEANKGENLRVVEEPEELLSPKGDMEVLCVENLAKIDNLDINPKSTKSEAFCFSTNSPNCHSKGEQEEYLSTDAIGSIKDTIKRSKDKASSGEETEQSDTQTLYQAREPPSNPSQTLMRVTRKKDYPEEGENREEDNTENRNTEVCLVLEKTGVSTQNSSDIVEAATFSKATRKHYSSDSGGETSCKRMKHDSILQSPEVPSESGSQVEQEDDSQFSTSQGKKSDNLTRQPRRSSKWTVLPKHVSELKSAAASASECETDTSEKGNQRQEVKLSVTRGKNLKTTHRKKSGKEHRSSKITLVTLRTSQEEEEEEADDFEPGDEDEYFAPEDVNKAPVFVPIGLRSSKPVPVQIEETMEELEIPVNIPDVQLSTESLSHASVEPVVQKEEKETTVHENPEVDKGVNDGSAEAAMTLLAMGDPTFQLKTSTEEWTQMLPNQDELDVANSLVTHTYSKQNRTPSQYLLPSDTSTKESVPSEDGSHVNVEDQSTGTRIGVKGDSEKNATDISDGSLHVVDSMRLAEGRLLKPEPDSGVLKSNENIIQNSLNTDVLVEQLEQGQSESTVLRGTAEMQKVDLEQVRHEAGASSVLHDFTNVEHTKEVDKTERNKMRDACGNSGELRPGTASPKPEKSHLGLEDCPNQSSVDELHEQNSGHPEHSICMINFIQKEACAQDRHQQCASSTEETSVVNNDHKCPEEEQTFILTLVEITADSKEFDAPAVMEETSEPLLPAPVLINPINTSETSTIEEKSIGSLTTTADAFTAPLNSSMETQQLERASTEPVPNLQTTQKRSAAELEEDDFPPAKKTLSAVVVEDNLETRSQDCSVKSASTPVIDSGDPFQKTEASSKEEILKSVSESVLPLAERSQLETLENLGKAPLENSASKQEEDMTSGLTSNRKAEINGQGKQGDVHESEQLEHAGSLASSSKSPLLRGGRKPLGFLSLICKKSTSEPAENTKQNRGKILKGWTVTPKKGLNNPTPSSKDDKESCSHPSTSTSSSVEDEIVATDAAVTVPSNEPSEKPPLCAKGQEKEEEPRIFEYFFSDIFMEVDDSE